MNNLFISPEEGSKRLNSSDNMARIVEVKPVIQARTDTKEFMENFFHKNQEKSLTKSCQLS